MSEQSSVPNLSVDLAPRHKSELLLRSPILLGCGAAGFGAVSPMIDTSALGAAVTLPVCSLDEGAESGFAQFPGGVVIARVGPPAARTVLRRWQRAWARAGLPIIARVEGTEPSALAACVSVLDESQEIVALEWTVGSLLPEEAERVAARIRASTAKPLLVQVPLSSPAPYCEAVQESTDAFVIGQAPNGSAWSTEGAVWVRGEVHGAGTYPLALDGLLALKDLPFPLVAHGGIHTPEQAVQAILAGATALMLDTAIYRQPGLPAAALSAIIREMGNRGLSNIHELIGREAR